MKLFPSFSKSLKNTGVASALLFAATLNSYAQFAPGTTAGTTVTGDKVGIGISAPTSKLHVISGFTTTGGGVPCVNCIPPGPCTYYGQLALTVQFNNPDMGAGFSNGCPNGPDIMQVFSKLTSVGSSQNSVLPHLWMNVKGSLGLGMYPKTGSQFAVTGNSYLNGNTQVATKLRINSNPNLTPNNWTAIGGFPYTFSVDNGDANFGGNSNFVGEATFNSSVAFQSTTSHAGNATFAAQVQLGPTHPDPVQYPNWRLGVDGDIVCKRAVVQLGYWMDAVFAPDYQLLPLSELAAYVAKERHLPGVPTEQEVIKNGVSVGDMSATLLQKVEELTLYLIELKKENEVIKTQIANLQSK